jgi:hypothetical protein
MSNQKVSFSRPSSSAPKPVTADAPPKTVEPTAAPAPAVVQNPEPAPAPQQEQRQVPAAPAQSQAVVPSYYGGEEETDAADIRFPRLNIAQKTSAAELVKLGLGQFILNKDTALGEKIRLVVCGFSPKKYSEKVKYGSPMGAMAGSLQEVDALGGTPVWRESKENAKSGSTKPWFQPMVTALLLIEQPENLDSDRFSYELDGKVYAPAVITLKSTSYVSCFVKLNSEQKLGLLRAGYPTRFIEVSSVLVPFTSGEAYQPQVKVLGETGPQLRAEASKLRG